MAGGKENEAEGGAGNSGGAVKGKGDEASVEGPDASGAGSDTRAAIISVSEERAEVLTMAPGCVHDRACLSWRRPTTGETDRRGN